MRPKSTTTASRRRLISLAVGVIFLFATAACDNNGDGLPKGDQAPPPQVTVMTVTPKTIPVTFEAVGETEGSREVEVRTFRHRHRGHKDHKA
jgi:membrane fusion protein (multidrug efflux system)